jgi:hypothetical protein
MSPVEPQWSALALRLARLGLWRHLPPAVAAEEVRRVAQGKNPFVLPDEDDGVRRFHVDGEAMAEGRVGDTLAAMAPVFAELGQPLTVEVVSRPRRVEEGDYVVAINGRRCRVLGPDDWRIGRPDYAATMRPLSVLNDLLAEAGSELRWFVLYPGTNFGLALLLDPAVVDAVAATGLIEPEQSPQRAVYGAT